MRNNTAMTKWTWNGW